jgi:hypothetical protein
MSVAWTIDVIHDKEAMTVGTAPFAAENVRDLVTVGPTKVGPYVRQ